MSQTSVQTQDLSMPWVEKYRPKTFGNIVLNDINKKICKNIVDMNYFPNLLFYGPPGTGKTTTIINLVKSFQIKNSCEDKGLMIHLNASDDRGIDIIRNQILQFVNSKSLFSYGLKFVILDEVDYMTKNAQQALRYLINMYSSNVRFCLICNYISRIDHGLQTEFLKIRFNNLPKDEITMFLKQIVDAENIDLSTEKIVSIQCLFGSDIRSMINFIQCNHISNSSTINIVDETVWNKLVQLVKGASKRKTTEIMKRFDSVVKYLHSTSSNYNITYKNIVKDFFTYLIKNEKIRITTEFLDFLEKLIHMNESNDDVFINYTLVNLDKFSNLL